MSAIGEQLVALGRAVRLETRGRRTGAPVFTTLGFVEEPDGALLVAAGSPDAHWARNLLASPDALATVGERTGPVRAELLEGAEHAAAVRELILKYGTPSEGLGAGPAFRLRGA